MYGVYSTPSRSRRTPNGRSVWHASLQMERASYCIKHLENGGTHVPSIQQARRVRVAPQTVGRSGTLLSEWNARHIAFAHTCGTAIENRP